MSTTPTRAPKFGRCKCGCGRIVRHRRFVPGCFAAYRERPEVIAELRAASAKGGRAGIGDAKRRYRVTRGNERDA